MRDFWKVKVIYKLEHYHFHLLKASAFKNYLCFDTYSISHTEDILDAERTLGHRILQILVSFYGVLGL